MPITLITGPANAGKAQLVMDAVRRHAAHGAEPLLVLPTRADADHYLRELSAQGVALGVRVERFDGLLAIAVQRAGIGGAPLDGLAREQLLAAVLARGRDGAPSVGVVRALAEAIAELRERRIAPERLAAAAGGQAGGDDRVTGRLARDYAAYARELARLGCVDGEERAVRALDELRLRPAVWGAQPVLVYGFDDLTPLQLDTIETLGRVVAAEVTVALAYEPGRAAFAGRSAAFHALAPLAAEHRELPARPEHYAPDARSALSHLERSLFEPAAERVDPGRAVRLLEGGGERAELELVAEEAGRLIDAGVAAEEIAIVVRARPERAALLAEVLTAAGVPFAMQRRRPFAHTAIGRALVAMLRCAAGAEHGSAGDLLAWLRGPGVLERPELADRLELELRRAGVVDADGARERWERHNWPLDALGRIADAAARSPGALIESADLALARLFSAPRRRAAAVLDAGELDEARALAAGSRALGQLRELTRLDARLAPAAPAQLGEILERLEVVCGDAPEPGRVAVLDPLALRARRVRALFACCLQEGTFPAPARPRAFLGDEQRRSLAEHGGLRLGEQQEALAAERYLLYAAVSRPDEWLYLSWHLTGDDGEPKTRSLFVDDVCDLFDERLMRERGRRALGAVAAPSDGAGTRLSIAAEGAPAHAAGVAPISDELLLRELGERPWSASSLERWIACPARWFVERLLQPKEFDPEAEPLARGGLAHDALRDVLEGLRAETGSARLDAAGLPLARRLLDRALAEHEAERPLSASPERRLAARRRVQADLTRYLEHAARGEPAAAGRARARLRLRGRRWQRRCGRRRARDRPGGSRRRHRRKRAGGASAGDARAAGVRPGRRRAPAGPHRSRRPDGGRRGARLRLQVQLGAEARALGDGRLRADGAVHARRRRAPVRARRGRPLPAAVGRGPARARGRRRGQRSRRPGRRPRRRPRACGDGGDRRRSRRPRPQGGGAGRARRDRAAAAHLRLPRRRVRVPVDLQVPAVSAGPAGTEPAALAERASRGPHRDGRSLTEEQLEAVSRRSEPLLLAAGAGSGKTSVLVERFVRAVIEDGTSPAAILAITFTDRAAGELRERVRARFLELGEREHARDAESAFVSTFHGFCARVLRAHALEAGIDPRFSVLDEGLAAGMRARAFDVGLAGFLADRRPAAVDLIAAYGADEVAATVGAAFAALRSRGERFPRLPVPATAAPVPATAAPVPATAAPVPHTAAPRQAAGGAAASADEVTQAAALACSLLDELLGRFARDYEELKRARSALDFDDLELLAKELLDGDRGLREAWAGRFELLMVDEFQDTNPRQLAIVRVLERDNLFTVGDELQAIYGFRHADVSLFRGRREQLRARGGDLRLTGNFRSRPAILDAVNAIFAQRLGTGFTPLVARRAVGDGDGDAATAARRGSASRSRSGGAARPGQQSLFDAAPGDERSEPRVELLLTARDGWDQPEEAAAALAAGMPAAAGWRRAEARALAQRIAELVDAGEARGGEVVVLLRATGDIEIYERALQLRGLRTLAHVGGFWGRLETRDLLAYLRALANPLDEAALYCALASPLAGISSDGLALIARAARAGGRGAWAAAGAIVAGEGGDEVPDEIGDARTGLRAGDRAALERFYALLADERRTAARRPVSQLLTRVIAAGGYREHLLRADWGERRLANVHKLQRVARRYEASEGGELRAFLVHVERLEAARVAEPDAPVEGVDGDTVRLMTVHAAKGLEFGVVCVADLGRALNMRMPRLLVQGDRIGLSLLRLDGQKAVPALEYEQLSEERRHAEADEEDRIFYVAMTRARERLLLSGATELDRIADVREGAPMCWMARVIAGSVEAPERLDPPVIDVTLKPPSPAPAGARAGYVRCRFNLPGRAGDVAPSAAVARAAAPARPDAQAAAPAPGPDPSPQAGRAGAHLRAPRFARLSYTALAELERCGYRYYLERVLALAEDAPAPGAAAGAALDARARGTLIHAVLEACGPLATRDVFAGALARRADEIGLALARPHLDELAAMLAAAAAAPLATRVGAADEVRREHPFAFALGPDEPLVTGVIDVLAREADSALVVDYKTDRVGTGDLDELVLRDYEAQRLVYALAVLRESSVAAVEVVHWYLERPQQPVTARYAAGERDALEASLADRVARVRERGFRVSPTPHRGLCATCPGRVGLCSWEQEMTLREAPGGHDPAPPGPRG